MARRDDREQGPRRRESADTALKRWIERWLLMANVNEGKRWTIHTGHMLPNVSGPVQKEPVEVVPAGALREAERRLADVRLSMVTLRREHAHAWEEVDRVTHLRDLGAKVIVDTEEALREAKAEVARLREVLDRFGGHRGDCNVIAGAPDCNCGFDEAYVRVRQAALDGDGR